MDKKEYLEVRKELSVGKITDKGTELMCDYWYKFKEPEYKEVTREEFKNKFIEFIQIAPYAIDLRRIVSYFDSEFTVTAVIDKKNNVLAFY